MSDKLSIVILAAGKGTRMKSALPKTLHKIASFTMLDLVIKSAESLKADNITIVISEEMGQFTQEITKNHPHLKLSFAIQKERLGTAHGVKIALQNNADIHNKIIVLYGDTPLITDKTLQNMSSSLDKNNLSILGFDCFEENKYGRLVINNNKLERIVEFKDANEQEKQITLCNSGVVGIKYNDVTALMNKIDNNNASQEFYLTDLVAIAINENLNVDFIKADSDEVLGVNSRIELNQAEEIKQNRIRKYLMENGVTLIDPKTNYFAADVKIENDVIIHPNVVIGKNTKIKNGAEIKSFSHVEGAQIAENVEIGPFARIRPGSKLENNVKIGNFVEVKKTKIAQGAKINHLSYIGDSNIGQNTNIGAGTITCNYDGYNKFTTNIGENVFIGSNNSLIAPVNIGNNSVVGAGSVVSKDVSDDELAVSRSKQINIKNGAIKYHKNKNK